MTDRIDHIASALEHEHRSHAAKTKGEATLHMAAAQMHATLALVEQQRIANLIAYFTADVVGGGAGSSGAIDDIRKGLGL